MTVQHTLATRLGPSLVVIVMSLAGLGTGVGAQKLTPGEAATKLSGTWVLNRELTQGFRSGGGGRRGGSPSLRLGLAPAFGQRGGGGGMTAPSDASDLSQAELAAMAAMRELQQVAEVITIKATPEQVIFEDGRGQRTYALDGKNVKVMVAGSEVTTKSRWDKAILKQEFSTASNKLTQTWDVDADGRLVLIAKVESLRMRTPDQKAVFDRKQ
jgi:hypothetical protein